MTTATAPPPPKAAKPAKPVEFDPDEFRMTVGEHLEELRKRFIAGLIGFAISLAICLFFSKRVVSAFCWPLIDSLQRHNLNTQMIVDEIGEGFMVFVKIALITAAAFASPWMLYQVWLFIAAGLYPHERKYVTRYLPLSIVLLVTGMLFVYFLVLPWTIDFFIEFSMTFTLDIGLPALVDVDPATGDAPMALSVPVYAGTPANLDENLTYIWFDSVQQRLVFYHQGVPRVLPFNSNNLLAPEIKLSTYITTVLLMLITFGIAFQMPLAVLFLERIGVVEVEGLRSARRYVYFGIVVLAAVISPGDAVTVTIALVGPLILLYEFGIWLAVFGRKSPPAVGA